MIQRNINLSGSREFCQDRCNGGDYHSFFLHIVGQACVGGDSGACLFGCLLDDVVAVEKNQVKKTSQKNHFKIAGKSGIFEISWKLDFDVKTG